METLAFVEIIIIITFANLFLKKRADLKQALRWRGQLANLEKATEDAKKELIALQSQYSETLDRHKAEVNRLQDITQSVSTQKEELSSITIALDEANKKLSKETQKLNESSRELFAIEQRTQHVLNLEQNVSLLENRKNEISLKINKLENELKVKNTDISNATNEMSGLMQRIDLYSRLDEFTSVGHFESPEYLYNTSQRYAEEIKVVRESQKKLINEKMAVTYPEDFLLCIDQSLNKRVVDGQIKLILNAFNIECDRLIGKVNPSNFARTVTQIHEKAEQLEKWCATLKCGFSTEYVKLKYDECGLRYEYQLKKEQEEQEQRLIKEQMREEARIQKQCKDAIEKAESEELLFRRLIEMAKIELSSGSDLDNGLTRAKISELEARLADAEERARRAKSLAEQTRAGYVYIISNIGSFGEGVYKIGLTRRADPNERVDELSGASVPFPFDVHAKILTEDAPGLEHKLHQRFKDRRVNAINIRKEFFRVSLHEIQSAIEEILEKDVDFIMTAKADDYYGSRRLLPS